MHYSHSIPGWKTSPFIRMVLPLFIGVILQWYINLELNVIIISGVILIILYFILLSFGLSKRFKRRLTQGLLIQMIITTVGMLLTWKSDIRNNKRWFGHAYASSDYLLLNINEPLIQKPKSYKADGNVDSVIRRGRIVKVCGTVIIYFRDIPKLKYGDRILINKPLQRIKSTGNPGTFDYARYAAFQNKFHTVFLDSGEYIILRTEQVNAFNASVFRSREHVLAVLRKFVSKDPGITGIAEALLIGYKHDLDKDLMQAYSNTGVVHIIAISGLHLGLIYAMLSWLLNALPWVKKKTTLKVITILTCLWLFSILTGSSASVLRSALMFTCILIGKSYFKQSSTYNAIAASVFMLICYNPYFLWDVGFQLSYLAVLGIVWLQKPIQRLLYIRNTWIAKVWSMVAVTLAAQIAAFPLCIFYFHQFPNLFLITNIIAVPLSTFILYAEIFLLCFSWIEPIAVITGKCISLLIEAMNDIIVFCNNLPGSVTSEIYATVGSTWLLYGIVFFFSAWLYYRKKIWLALFLVQTIAFAALHLYADILHNKQRKIIVYNINRQQAIDFLSGSSFYFLGDSAIKAPGFQQTFHIQPARISFQSRHEEDVQNIKDSVRNFIIFHGKRVLIIDNPIAYKPAEDKVMLDILIISHDPKLKIAGLVSALRPALIVFDASNSLWKIEQWKKECSALLLPFHSVPDQGAFVLDF